ncbi:MFS transporter-like protein 94 [Elsinoe australis]|uniref:MFS transporter-like protein 94 n=1 Tax=Elsinoe australis TaxID=40998 RepID=A0A4U7B1H1_9PEZI|nr:MFS transporter-like protein 94 [Elsinoe australis]
MDTKQPDDDYVEDVKTQGQLREERATDKYIRRQTDKYILSILVWVYFLQILDKSVLGYGSLFGLQQDTGLKGSQYSLVGSMAPIAQLVWLPFSSWLIVRVPPRILMSVLVFGWGVAQTCMAASHNYAGLAATRFFLGLFEAACLPLFSVLTSQWYRRREQPLRIAAWYGTNGLATMLGSALSFGLGHIPSGTLRSWQIIFLFVGLVTVLTAPLVYWNLDNNIDQARFLTDHQKAQARERLRSNNTGLATNHFRWAQVAETFLDPKTYLWFSMALLLNVGASVTNVFGPLILSGLGYDKYVTSLLNIPFGAVQLLIIIVSSYAAHKAKLKGLILAILILPVVIGLVVLYVLPRTRTAPNLVAYYLLACLFGGNPLIVTWIVGNTGGATKKSVLMVIYNIGTSAGNIIGPLLFKAGDGPAYQPGLKVVLALFCAMVVVVLATWALLVWLNKGQEKKRVAKGKPAKIADLSMSTHFQVGEEVVEGHESSDDLTDRRNEDFIYIY